MSTRWRKVLADFWSNRIRTVLMIITITVGVFSIGYVQSTGLKMNEDMEADYQSSNPPEATIYAWPMDDDTVKTISEVPGVGSVEGSSEATVQVLQDGDKKIALNVTAIKSPAEVQVGRLKPADPASTVLPGLNDHEILFDRSANTLQFTTGQKILVELPDGKQRELTFGGYVHDVTVIPYIFQGAIQGYVNPDTLVWLGGSRTYSDLKVSVDKNPTSFDYVSGVAQAVSDRLEDAGVSVNFVSVYNPGHHFSYEIAQGSFFIFNVLGWFTVLLSVVLVINTIISLMNQQKRQVGIMKAIGADDGQLLGMYCVLLMGFGLVAFVISVPLGAWVANNNPMTVMLNFNAGPFKIYPQVVLLQALVALLIPLAAAAIPLVNSIRQPAYESLSFQGIDNKAVAKKEGGAVSRVLSNFSRPVTISIRNAFRRKTRMALTLGTLVLGGAIFISVFNLWSSFDLTLKQVQGYFLADINVSLNRSYRYDKLNELAMTVPGITSTEGWMIITGQLHVDGADATRQIAFAAPPSNSTLIKPVMVAGRWLMPSDENAVVIGNHLLKIFPTAKVGDWLTIDLNGRETKWLIVGQYIMPGNANPPILYTNYEYLSRLMDEPGQVYSLRVLTAGHDAASQQAATLKLQEVLAKNKIQVSSMQTASEWNANQTSSTNMLVYFMMAMAILIAVVGGVGLMGTMSINVMERTREIGVMRAIGADNMDVQQVVIVEGIFVGLVSWFISFFVAIPITLILTYGVGVSVFTAALPVVFGATGPLVWLVGSLLIAVLSSVIPARRASRLTVRDTLVYE